MDLIWKILNPANLLPYKSLGGGPLGGEIGKGNKRIEHSVRSALKGNFSESWDTMADFSREPLTDYKNATTPILPESSQGARTEQKGVSLLKGKYESFFKPRK